MIKPMTEAMYNFLREWRMDYSDEGDGTIILTENADEVLSFQQEFIKEIRIVSLQAVSMTRWEVKFDIL